MSLFLRNFYIRHLYTHTLAYDYLYIFNLPITVFHYIHIQFCSKKRPLKNVTKKVQWKEKLEIQGEGKISKDNKKLHSISLNISL